MSHDRLRVLLVDDEKGIREPLAELLPPSFGFEVDAAADYDGAMQFIERNQGQYDVALIDRLLVPAPDGIQVMRDIKARYPEIECIIASGLGTEERQIALQEGAFRYIEKPFDIDELAMLIHSAAQQARLRAINREMLSQRDLDSVLRQITATACSLVRADEAEIQLRYESTDSLRSHGWPAASSEGGQSAPHPTDLIVRQILATGKTETFADLSREERLRPLVEQGFQSLVCVPIPGEQGSLGALCAYSRRPNHFARGSDVVLLQTLAGQAGLAILNARAFEDTRTHARYMETLVQITEQLTQTTDRDEQLQLAWDFVRDQLKTPTFIIALANWPDGTIDFPMFYDKGERHSQPPIPLERATRETIIGHVITSSREFFAPTSQAREQQCASLDITSTRVGDPCETCLYLPLNVSGEVLGAISVQAYDPHAFPLAFQDAFRALANHLAVALSNSRLFTNTQKQAKDLQTLLRLSRDVASTLETRQVLEHVCKAAVDFFQAEHSGLLLFEEPFEFGEVVAEYPGNLQARGLRVPLRGVADEEELLNLREPLVIDRVAERHSLGPVRDILRKLNIQSTLIIPVIVKDKLLGSVSIDAVGHERRFTPAEVELAQAFAAQVAVAVDHAHNYEESESRARLLETLDEASRHIRAEKDPERLMHEIVRLATELVGCRRGCLLEYERHRGELEVKMVHRLSSDLLYQRVSHDVGIIGRAVLNGVSEPCIDYDVSPSRDPLFENSGLNYGLAIPLRATGEVTAVLFLGDKRAGYRLEPVALEALERFVGQAAIALHTSKMLTSEQRAYVQREILLQVSNYIQAIEDTDKILHVILTGVTAGYGLGFNRAALLLMENDERLVGRLGIGYPDEQATRQAWRGDQQYGLDGFDRYIKLLESGTLEPTPIDAEIRKLNLSVSGSDIFTHVMTEGHYRLVDEDHQYELPAEFVSAFRPAFPLIVVALIARNKSVGLLVADNKFTRAPITEEHILSLLTYANTAAIAIENKRLLQDSQVRLAQVEQAHEAARVVAEAVVQRDLHQTLSEITAVTRTVMKADAVTLYAFDEAAGRFTEWGTDNPGVRDPRSLIKPEGLKNHISSPYKLLRLTEKPYYRLVEADLKSDEVLGGHYMKAENMQAAIGLQLRAAERKMGVMYVNYRTPHRFSPDEISTIQLFAGQAAAAIRIKQLYDEANHRTEQSRLVAEIGREASYLELQPFLGSLFGRLVKLFSDRDIPVYPNLGVYEAQRHTLELIPTPYYPAEIRTPVQSIDDESIMTWVAKHRESRYAPNVNEDVHYNKLIADTQSEYAVPILFSGELLGVLDLESPVANAFREGNRELLDTIANQIASTLHNVRQYEELKRTQGLVGTRTALAWMGMIAGVYRHEMGNSVTVIKERLDLLRKDLGPQLTEQLNQHLNSMERVAIRMQAIPLAPPLSVEGGVKLVPLCELLRKRIGKLRSRDLFKDIVCEVRCGNAEGCVARVSPEWIERLVDLLAHNAAAAMAGSAKKKLIVNMHRGDNQLEVSIQDTGPGIPDWQREYLFNSPIPKKPDEPGSGMGLLIAQLIVETYSGGIECEHSSSNGTTMRFWLPIEE